MTDDSDKSAAAPERTEPAGGGLVRDMQDEADLCRNEGATDIANLLDRAARALAEAQAENKQWRTWGIVEIAARNPSVMEYMDHWENRTLKAEAALAETQADARHIRQENENYRRENQS